MNPPCEDCGGSGRPLPPPFEDREANRAYADEYGFFWLPCPLCRTEFGGHEWGNRNQSIPTGKKNNGTHQAVCPRCIGRPETLREAHPPGP